MAQATVQPQPQATAAYMEPINKLLEPTRISSLRGTIPAEGVKVYIIDNVLRLPKEPTLIKNIFPFSTVEDLKYEIWLQLGAEPTILPQFQSLLTLRESFNAENPDAEYPQKGQDYYGADYLYFDTSASLKDPLVLQSPLDVVGGSVDERFVDVDGQLQPLKIIKRERSTFEDLFLSESESTLPVFHVFLLSGLRQVLPPATAAQITITEYDFNGRIAPYFPALSAESPLEPSETVIANSKKIMQVLRLRNRQLENVERILEEDVPGLKTPILSGITKLRLVWQENSKIKGRLDELFYKLDANESRPFMRFLPVDGIPLTKLYSPPGSFSIPETIPIELIKQWAQEKSPISDADYVFIKILLFSGGFPLFGTLKIMEDGSADFVVVPPKNVRKLTPSVEFSRFSESFIGSLTGTGYETTPFSVQETSAVSFFSIDGPRLNAQTIRKKLQSLSYFFQEISPLPNEQPLISLRYKRVSNFANEDRVFSFLTQVITKKLVDGTETLAGLPKLLAEEFNISEKEAEQRIIAWNKSREQFTVGATTKKDIKQAINPGTDIYIYAQHPLYFCHIYRADSGVQLDRIYILLSILLNVADDELRVAGAATAAEAALPEAHISPSGDLIKSVTATATEALAPRSPEVVLPQATEEMGEDFGGYDYGMYEIPDNEDESAVGPAVVATELPPSDAPTKEDVLVAQETKPTASHTQAPTEIKAPPPEDEGKIVVDSFFLNRLKQIDRELFNFKKTKGDKSITNYSVSCAANEDRQPLIMDELQYKRMRDIYDEDEDLVFIEYPLREKKNPVVPKDKEIAYVLKYGSDPGHQNYFICSEYFCVRDDIWLRKKEFENGTVDREGKPKKKATCPFCHGTVIKSKDSPNPGETVLKRKNKPKKDIPQLFISFLRKKKNPNGLSLPCCFVDSDIIRYEEEAFNHIREYEQKYMKVEEDGVSAATREPSTTAGPPPLPDIQQEVPNYDILRNHLNSEYIVGPEKYPLEPGKVGLCPAPLDRYLGQISQTLVSRDAIRQELKKNAMGFLRIGVQNSAIQRDVSLFSALAPLLGVADTSQEVASFIKKSINPLLFQSLNFGNLVLEFYNPQDAPPTDTEFDLWIKRNVPRAGKIVKNTIKYDYLIRLYNSYKNFEAFIETPTRRKELRQFVHILAEPGVLTERGITIIVLDYTGPPNSTDTEIRVRCPLQAYAAANYVGNDIAFLTHDEKGIWEPLIFTNNVPAVGGQVARHEGVYVLQANEIMFRKLPDEIKSRIREFKEKCNSSGVAAYTSQIGVKPETLIPKYTLLYADEREQVPYGLVRDAYNHLVAATFVTNTKKVIAVPLADDGTLDNFPERKQVATGDEKKIEVRKVHFGWDDIWPLPTTDEIIDFYKGEINVKYSLYKGYEIESIILYRDGSIAVKLRNGIPIPAGFVGEKYKGTVPEEESDTFPEWYIDNGIVMSKVSTDKQKDELAETFIPKQRKQIEEVFQHLRFTFANYISRNRKIFKNIKAIVDPRRQEIGTAPPIPLELFERRKRLEILLGPLIHSWLAPQDPFNPEETLLRMDCSQITDAGRCSNFCTWKQGAAAGVAGGSCLIHTPTKIPVGSKKEVEAVRFFTLRLLEEILRIPEKRRQLFNKEVSYLSSPKATTRIGNQLIIPEINSQWYQILIEEKLPKGLERPRFFEEFSRIRTGELEGEAVAEPLPSALTEILGAEAAKNFQLWVAPNLYALMVPLNIRLLDFIEEGQEFQVIPEEVLKKISFALKRTVVQLDLNVAAYFSAATIDKITDDVVVIIITETGEPAFLVDVRFPTKPLVARSQLGNLQENISEIRLRARARLVRPKMRGPIS